MLLARLDLQLADLSEMNPPLLTLRASKIFTPRLATKVGLFQFLL